MQNTLTQQISSSAELVFLRDQEALSDPKS